MTRRKIIPYNRKLKQFARNLRNKSTKSEILLWSRLKGKIEGKFDFHRQKPLDNFIADFFCHELRLVIELDGLSHEFPETRIKDLRKECRLNGLKLNVLRYDDHVVYNQIDSIVEDISDYIKAFETGDPSCFEYEDSPLNPLSKHAFIMPEK